MSPEQAGARVDQYLVKLRPDLTRSRLKALIEEGVVLLNGGTTKPSRKLRAGDALAFTEVAVRPSKAVAEPLPLSVLYEDPDLVVIDKSDHLALYSNQSLLIRCATAATQWFVERLVPLGQAPAPAATA